MAFFIENNPRTKSRLHIIIGCLIAVVLTLGVARIAEKGTPKTSANTWVIAVTLKSAVVMAYQVLTTRIERLKRWASLKAYMILNMIDTVFWFALFIISILGTAGAASVASRALGVIIILLAVVLCFLAGCLSWFCYQDHRYYKTYGCLPGAGINKVPRQPSGTGAV